MASHYYDEGPRVTLERPLALVAWVTADARAVGRAAAALLGLPFADVDRLVEHDAGRSLAELLAHEGEDGYRERERRALARALADRPAGVVSLGDGALLDPANRDAVRRGAVLALLDLDLPNLYWRLAASGGESVKPQGWHPLHAEPLTELEQLRSFYRARRPGFAAAAYRLEARGRSATALARELVARVPDLRAGLV